MAGQGGPPGDDDAPEIVVQPQPAPAPQRKRPRTPNPAVDDVIHTGEIAPRSLIIKSNPSIPKLDMELPKVEVKEDPTEPVVPPPRPAAPAHRRLRLGWLLAAIAAGAGAGVLMLVDTNPPAVAATTSEADTTALQSVAQFIGTTFDADARAAMVRAEAIASNPVLRAGVETDAATLIDMAHDSDVVFPIKGAEVVEVFQVKDGARTSMLRLPKGAAALQPPPVGKTKLVAGEGELLVLADASVANRAAGKASLGEVALAVPIDLNAVRKRVASDVTGATLVGLGAPVTLVPSTNGGAGTHVKLPIDTEGKAPLTLDATLAVAAPPVVKSSSKLKIVRYACFGLAGLLLLVFLGTSARRSS
ncbi:MAG: hypothetical protein ACM31C_34415 [Acidobacteriota bacterium]